MDRPSQYVLRLDLDCLDRQVPWAAHAVIEGYAQFHCLAIFHLGGEISLHLVGEAVDLIT